jgi:hypothetical protein
MMIRTGFAGSSGVTLNPVELVKKYHLKLRPRE